MHYKIIYLSLSLIPKKHGVKEAERAQCLCLKSIILCLNWEEGKEKKLPLAQTSNQPLHSATA